MDSHYYPTSLWAAEARERTLRSRVRRAEARARRARRLMWIAGLRLVCAALVPVGVGVAAILLLHLT